jgi:Ni/Fe-hydrogenase subunit HybB-like protein
VGVAAGAVTVVFPAYVYKHEGLHDVAVIGEMIAIFAVTICTLFVFLHVGRPDRIWHMLPYIGVMNWPSSVLTSDVVVLTTYLFLNAITGFYFLYQKYYNRPINKRFFMPIIYLSIVWAISIHTVTAFLMATFDTRAMWHTGMMPIRFIITAFAAGPAFIVIVLLQLKRHTALVVQDSAINFLMQLVTWCLGIALFLTLSEVVIELYQGSGESYGLRYLMFGMYGLTDLVPWFWASMGLTAGAFLMLLFPSIRLNQEVIPYICTMAFVGIWIEKGMGLVIPGEIPSPIGEFSQYVPSTIEIMNSVGIWAFGFFLLTLLLKGAAGILSGEVRHASRHEAY